MGRGVFRMKIYDELVGKLAANKRRYFLNSILLALLIMVPLTLFVEFRVAQRLAMFFIFLSVKIVLDIHYKLDDLIDKIPRWISILAIILLLSITPVGKIYSYPTREFYFSPESALGVDIDHIELIEENIYAAYWANGLEYGAAILENTLGGLRWKVTGGAFYDSMRFGDSYWDATAISFKEDDSNTFYYAAFFKTYEPEIKGNELILRYTSKSLGFNTTKVQLNGEIKPGINFFTGVGQLEEEPLFRNFAYLERRIIIDGVEIKHEDGTYARYRTFGGYRVYETTE